MKQENGQKHSQRWRGKKNNKFYLAQKKNMDYKIKHMEVISFSSMKEVFIYFKKKFQE